MKLLFRSYLASLREREELDAILPDLLSELGYLVFSRPGRGTMQAGVDVAALSPEVNGERKLCLFTIKRGDITRQNWDDNTPQGLRQSLNTILDKYLHKVVPRRFDHLKVVVCVVFGGDMVEQVRGDVEGFFERNRTERISFEEWNGDKLAELLMTGVLREDIMPKPVRSHFQKAVAMVDEPDVAYAHFAQLVASLGDAANSDKDRVRAARQMYMALWVLYVWARDIENTEAAYRTSELVVLRVWDMLRPYIDQKGRARRDLDAVLRHAIHLHLGIAREFLETKVLPHVRVLHGVSIAVRGEAPADVNLALFDVLGRVALTGLWSDFFARCNPDETAAAAAALHAHALSEAAFELIAHNPALWLPAQDEQAIEVGLCLLLACRTGEGVAEMKEWVARMAGRYVFAFRTHGRYPSVFEDYADVVAHPAAATDEYRAAATSGSTLLPLLASVLVAGGEREAIDALVTLRENELAHCTWQLWTPDEATDAGLYVGGKGHGFALADLPLSGDGYDLLEAIELLVSQTSDYEKLSAVTTGFLPILLMACRHFRMPLPPQMWLPCVTRPEASRTAVAVSDTVATAS